MIYCGYQGVGKSTYCREHSDAYDLDSSAFTKELGWERKYIARAKELSAEGYKVFISAHKCVIEEMIAENNQFAVLIPSENADCWRARLLFRYEKNPIQPNMNAIIDFDKNYKTDMEYYKSLEMRGVTVHRVNAKIVTTISDFI